MTNKFKIDEGIPMPEKRHSPKYPWKEMEVGDSFFVPKRAFLASSASLRYAPKKFSQRAVDGGVRVWRVE
jgi:hypothetical protein